MTRRKGPSLQGLLPITRERTAQIKVWGNRSKRSHSVLAHGHTLKGWRNEAACSGKSIIDRSTFEGVVCYVPGRSGRPLPSYRIRHPGAYFRLSSLRSHRTTEIAHIDIRQCLLFSPVSVGPMPLLFKN